MKLSEVVFLEVEDVVLAHASVIERFGGSPDVRDHGVLDAVVMAPREGYFGSLAELAAVLLHRLATSRPFVDGNDRVAFAAAVAFLRAQGLSLDVEEDRWEEIVEDVASGAIDWQQLALLFAAEIGDSGALR